MNVNAIRSAANNCGISCKGMTVQELQIFHNKQKHPLYADQFDMQLEELLAFAMKVNPNFKM